MRISTVTDPATSPILLDELKDHLRLDGSSEDAALGALIAAATTLVETWLDGALIERMVDIFLDGWPLAAVRQQNDVWWNGVSEGAITDLTHEQFHASLPMRPISSITGIYIQDSTGADVEWSAENYYLKPGLSPAVVRKYGRMWPVPGMPSGGIRIRAVAGFGADWNSVPAGIRQAVLMLASHLYYNRGDTTTEPAIKASGALTLLMPYREARL